MKQFIIISVTFLFVINFANATVIIIQAIGNTPATEKFIPQTATAICGDTIKWVNVSGTHTTASTTIPSGAAPWNSPSLTTAGFIYVVTKAGTYNYTCHPASGGHMPAKIMVTCTNGVSFIDHTHLSFAYPIPFSNNITIQAADVDMIILYNILGNKIKSVPLEYGQTKVEVDVIELTKGTYFYSIIKEGVIIETRKLVKM